MKFKRGKKDYVEGNDYKIRKSYAVGFTKKGEEYILDIEDVEKAKNYTWYIDNEGYVTTSVRDWTTGKQYHEKLHRLVLGLKHKDGKIVDHINRVKADNRKTNLRIVDEQINRVNSKLSKNNKSGVQGVFYRQRKGKTSKWVASITINGKTIQLGYYDKKEDAIKARKEAEVKYFGNVRYEEGAQPSFFMPEKEVI